VSTVRGARDLDALKLASHVDAVADPSDAASQRERAKAALTAFAVKAALAVLSLRGQALPRTADPPEGRREILSVNPMAVVRDGNDRNGIQFVLLETDIDRSRFCVNRVPDKFDDRSYGVVLVCQALDVVFTSLKMQLSHALTLGSPTDI
jgi:hypothetical protein